MMMYFAFEFLTDEYHYVGGLGRRVDFEAADVYDAHELILTMHENWEYNLNFSKEFVEANFSNLLQRRKLRLNDVDT